MAIGGDVGGGDGFSAEGASLTKLTMLFQVFTPFEEAFINKVTPALTVGAKVLIICRVVSGVPGKSQIGLNNGHLGGRDPEVDHPKEEGNM